jgi:hypothetical protein
MHSVAVDPSGPRLAPEVTSVRPPSGPPLLESPSLVWPAQRVPVRFVPEDAFFECASETYYFDGINSIAVSVARKV